MVYRGFMDNFNHVNVQDDLVNFHYTKENYEVLKEFVESIDITVCRAVNAVKNESLDFLIRKIDSSSDSGLAVEMIPVQGVIGEIGTRWLEQTKGNYSFRIYPNSRCEIGKLVKNNRIDVLKIWYSKETYIEANPSAKLDIKDVVKDSV